MNTIAPKVLVKDCPFCQVQPIIKGKTAKGKQAMCPSDCPASYGFVPLNVWNFRVKPKSRDQNESAQ